MRVRRGARGEVVVVCGLAAEARIAARAGLRCIAGGGDAVALAAAIDRALQGGARAVLSFGIAGALAAELVPGSLVVATAVVDVEGAAHAVDARWAERLFDALHRAAPQRPSAACVSGIVCGSDRIVASSAAKKALHARFGAAAVDMESHVAARLAAARDVPFAALRAIADPADRALPPAALVGMRPGGGLDVLAVLASLARAPGQLPALLAVAGAARAGLGALERGRRALGRGFGDLDLDELSLDVV